MAKVITTELQHSGASAANITLDSSKNVTCENNLQVDGNVTVTGTLPADKLTGNLPAISGASLTGITTRTTPFRNLIINGAFQIAQRGTSSTSTVYQTVDRWMGLWGGTDENCTQAQVALTSSDTGPWAKGFRKAFQITNGNQTSGAGANDYVQLSTSLESQDIANSGWDYTSTSGKVAFSFWVKSSVAQNFYGNFKTVDGTAQNYTFETGSLSANTWTKITKIIPGAAALEFDNDNTTGLEIYIVPFQGTDRTASMSLDTWAAYSSSSKSPDMTSTWYTTNDATFAITGVQLEVGDAVTDFEHRSYHDELLRCQRYFWMYYYPTAAAKSLMVAHNWHTNQIFGHINFPCRMRSAPSGVVTNGTDYWTAYKTTPNTSNFDTMSQWNANENSAILEGMSPSVTAGESCFCTGNNASASFAFNAEL